MSLSTIAAYPIVPFLATRISFNYGEILLESFSCNLFETYLILFQSIFLFTTFVADKNGIPLLEYSGVLWVPSVINSHTSFNVLYFFDH